MTGLRLLFDYCAKYPNLGQKAAIFDDYRRYFVTKIFVARVTVG